MGESGDYAAHSSAEIAPGAKIGAGTRVWRQAQVREGAVIGRDCVIGKDVYIDRDVVIGDRVKIQNGVSVYRGVTLEDDVFVGPGAVFTNDLYPRAFSSDWQVVPTRVKKGASIGANATVICGVTIGEYALIGAGAVVTRDVPPYSLMLGNPARAAGRVDEAGRRVAGEAAPAGWPAARGGRVRVGVIGAGQMGKNHVRALLSLREQAELAGVADPGQAVLAEVQAQSRAAVFADYRELLPLIDAAIVAVPTALHATVARDCLLAGKHLLVEKPLAATAAEARQLAELAEERGLVLLAGHVERFNPAVNALCKALGGAGKVIGLQARRLSPFSRRGLDMDVVADLMLHDIDIVRLLVGAPVIRCQASGIAVLSDKADHVAATLTFQGGAVATLVASRATQEKVRTLEVSTTDAYYCLDFLDRKLSVTRHIASRHEQGVYRQESCVEKISIPNAEPLVLEVAHFLACVRGEQKPQVSGRDAVAVMELIEQIGQQMAWGCLNQP